MGLMDDIAAAESARQRGEPMGGRTRRKVGGIVVLIGIALTLMGSWASSWHVYDFDVVGYGRAQVKVGLWDIEACPEKGECEEMSRAGFERSLGTLSRASDADMDDWLGSRWQVGIAMFVGAAAGAILLGAIVAGMKFREVRATAAVAFIIAGTALVLALRSLFAEPIDFMGFGTATFLALAGLFDLMLGAVLIGITRVGETGPLPAAKVVRGR